MLADDQSYSAKALPRNLGNFKNTHTTFGLTPRQAEVLACLRRHIADLGMVPTYDDICRDIGMKSKSGVHRIMEALETRGIISRIPGHARAIRINEPAAPSIAAAIAVLLCNCNLSGPTSAELRAILADGGAA